MIKMKNKEILIQAACTKNSSTVGEKKILPLAGPWNWIMVAKTPITTKWVRVPRVVIKKRKAQ